ncbi:MAG: mechanosensitive ion channel family protein [Candidatus Glassbacteria bacterium]
MGWLAETFGGYWIDIIISFSIIFIAYFIGVFIRSRVWNRLHGLAEKTSWNWDDPIVNNLKKPVVTWFLLAGAYGVKLMWEPFLPPTFSSIIGNVIFIFLGISVLFFIAKTVTDLIGLYGDRVALPGTGLTQTLVKTLILIIGGLIILSSLGVSITPLLTTLGVGGLAVALALQDTLSNLFSGFYITMARNIRQGDFIRLESGEEGYVVDIGWRASVIRMLPNNVVIIPNSKLANSIITNYYLPEKEMSVLVQVGVHYDSDLEHVERVTIETARECQKSVDGAIPTHEPFIRYHTFDSSSINFSVILRTGEFTGNYLLKHEFIKRLQARYREEGIVIPFPIRALNVAQEGAQHVLPTMARDGEEADKS